MDKLTSLQQIERDKQIDGWAVRLYFWSRDPVILTWIAVGMVGIGLGVAWLIGKPLET